MSPTATAARVDEVVVGVESVAVTAGWAVDRTLDNPMVHLGQG